MSFEGFDFVARVLQIKKGYQLNYIGNFILLQYEPSNRIFLKRNDS